MWTCPKCKQKFVNRNQWHSCGQNTLGNFLEGKSLEAVGLFNHFIKSYKKIGPFDLHPAKTRVALVAKIRFASINKIGKDFIRGRLLFNKPYENAGCFYKIEPLVEINYYVHHFQLRHKEDINNEFKKYMRLAYDIGQRKHINKGEK
jgi:Domain of unknown function (DUF5655)